MEQSYVAPEILANAVDLSSIGVLWFVCYWSLHALG